MITQEERDRERQFFESERKRAPDLFERPPMIDSKDFLRSIGIDDGEGQRPIGYLRLMPQDFIVEEIDRGGAVHTVDPEPLFAGADKEGDTWYGDLVKAGISTLDAKDMLAATLGIDQKSVGFAGIKDRLALTAQLVSIRGVADPGGFEALNAENFFLKNLRRGKGAIANGELKGNRFTIVLRSPEPIPNAAQERIQKKIEEVKETGFWNFFSFQRFGTPRLLSHRLGMCIVKKEYENAVRTFITTPAARELPYFKQMREAIGRAWGDWASIHDKFSQFPYHFHLELQMLGHLGEHTDDFSGALRTLPDQVRLWIYAYDCYLFNRKLSDLIKGGEVPVSLPLVTSFNPADWKPYEEYLREDGVQLPSQAYRDFPFVRVASRTWPTLQHAEFHGTAFREKEMVIAFSLPKGSYATTLLGNFFTLASGLPIPAGISRNIVDAKEVLGLGTLSQILERFKAVLARREEDIAVVEGE